MKLRNVNIKQIMSMNYDNKQDGIVPVQNLSIVFSTFDLISGINEYINYGRSKGLRDFFKDAKDNGIKEILDTMEDFSNNLQLCRTGYVLEKREKLDKLLRSYIEKDMPENDTYGQLFRYVAKDIAEGYKEMINGDLPDIINWCINKDFIQQALTFAAEELPRYFWDSKVFYASDSEKQYFNGYLSKTNETSFKTRKSKNPEKNVKYPYEWMIAFAPNSFKYKDRNSQTRLLKELKQLGMERADILDTTNENSFVPDDIKKLLADRKQTIYKPKTNAKALMLMREKGIDESKCSGGSLFKILLLYFIAKEQRNQANHANDSNEEMLLSYDQITGILVKLVSNLNKAKDK